MYYIYGSDPPYTRAFNPAFSRCMSHNQHPTHLLTASHCARYLHSKAPLQRKGHSRLEGLPSFKNYIPTSVRSLPTGHKTRRPSLFYIFHSHVSHIITHWPKDSKTFPLLYISFPRHSHHYPLATKSQLQCTGLAGHNTDLMSFHHIGLVQTIRTWCTYGLSWQGNDHVLSSHRGDLNHTYMVYIRTVLAGN
jgi:hypothetical protein